LKVDLGRPAKTGKIVSNNQGHPTGDPLTHKALEPVATIEWPQQSDSWMTIVTAVTSPDPAKVWVAEPNTI